jgi:hypothetical protein
VEPDVERLRAQVLDAAWERLRAAVIVSWRVKTPEVLHEVIEAQAALERLLGAS